MSTLALTGWNEGINTIELVRAVRSHCMVSLSAAKSLVERLLSGEAIELKFENDLLLDKFKALAASLGAVIGAGWQAHDGGMG